MIKYLPSHFCSRSLHVSVACLWAVSSAAFSAQPAKAPQAGTAAAAPAAVSAAAEKPAAPGVPSFADFTHWHRQYLVERGKAAKGAACIRSSSCISDESDYFRHIEAAHNIRKSIEGWAKSGNHDAAYYAGLMAFDEAKRFDEEFRIYAGHKDERYLEAGRKFLEASDRERRKAKEFLHPAAYAHRADSCMLMGDILEYEKMGNLESKALVFYYCASREYFIAGHRDQAVRAYTAMLRNGHPQSPMIIEMHARLFSQQPPNLWRPISSNTAAGSASAAAAKPAQ
ncbi:MAG: hypothetical protein ACKO2B_02870 [Betaproteobacteria bacterium]